MPPGEIHVKIWKAFFPVTLFVALYVGIFWNWYIALFVIVGWILHGFGIDPDLDLNGISRSEALWTKYIIFIPLIGWSTFYSRIFQEWGSHRGFWTHGPVISTLIRLLFFGFPFIVWFRDHYTDTLWREFTGMFIGLAISDFWHIWADAITGELNFGGRFGGKSIVMKYLMKRAFGYPPDKKTNTIKNKRG